MSEKDNSLMYGPDDKISNSQSFFLGLQHVLAMDVYVPPVIIAGLLAMGVAQKTSLIQATFLAAGIGTILQTKYFMKMPISAGPSFIPISAIAGVYFTNGAGNNRMATVIGSFIIGSILLILLGLSGFFQKVINYLVPSIVGGTIISCVGLSLMPSALNDNIFKAPGNVNQNILLASITCFILIFSIFLGLYFPKAKHIFKVGSIILALLVGSLVAYFMGLLDLSVIKDASWITIPKFNAISYGIKFSPSAIFTFVIIYAILTTETAGTWFAMSATTGEKIDDKQWNRGIIGEGISCLIASIIGSTPVTSYSTNAGVISITGVASKKVFISAGFTFVALGFLGKISAFLSAIPSPVIGGVFSVICVTIMLNGLKVIKGLNTSERDLYVVGMPIVLTMAMILIPGSVIKETPQIIQYLLGSPIAVAAIVSIILNLIMPKRLN
ncbi:purine permease [Lactobacillus sp. S2-2]|uniref:uracil-xanthine permease family protein n=1 Tax=Lactobacillus sp. S2-2 TaxID=2692917 RepID=UPI001F01F0A2|nr:solute carrier family 23 protein [Lactobacillus sp. S2-2]MCF6515608.1 purine permease [Lactobacillus sp. S2-2]